MRQPDHTANIGFGIEPDPDCAVCMGKGFRYYRNWARTCEKCKVPGVATKVIEILEE